MQLSTCAGIPAIHRAVATVLLFQFLFGLQPGFYAQKPSGLVADAASKAATQPVTLGNLVAGQDGKMPARTYAELKTESARNRQSRAKAKAKSGGEVVYDVFNIEFKTTAGRQQVFTDQRQSKLPGAYILTVFDQFADVFVDSDAAWNAIARNPNVLKVDFATQVNPPPPPETKVSQLVSQAVPEAIVRGGLNGLTGKNVVIALLDTGIDFRHPDFITYDSQNRPASRIRYLWDTSTEYQNGRGSAAPFKFPNGTSIGTLYTQEQLTNELRSPTATIPATDIDGHGTACTSVAAGNGNADKLEGGLKRKEVEGVAPEAEIIGVRLGYDGLENGYLLNAIVEWLDKVAGTTPLVISGSFGGHYAGHDGQTVEERELNARFPLNKAGRSIVFAAGNEGSDRIHATVKFSGSPRLLSWEAKEDTLVRVYFDSDEKTISITPSADTPLNQQTLRVLLNPITGQYEGWIRVKAGPGSISLANASGRSSEAHAYFFGRSSGAFSPENASADYLVGTPGSTPNAITVGSYDWNDNFYLGGQMSTLTAVCRGNDGSPMPFEVGWLSCYSSPGPLRRVAGNANVTKPDIVSPGEWYSSSYAHIPGQGGVDGWRVDSTGNYVAMNGTSAATPYTAGVIALVFQKKPTLTVKEVKELLVRNSSKAGLNPAKGAIPNNNWGYGKLDLEALNRIFQSL